MTYNFIDDNGRVTQLSEWKHRITYVDDYGRVRLLPTAKARAKYYALQAVLGGYRPFYNFYWNITRPVRRIAAVAERVTLY